MSGNFEGIKTQKFGVEVECTGLTRADAAKAISKVLGNAPRHFGGSYDRYDVYDNQDRLWKIMSDASIRCTTKDEQRASKQYSVELVTPILEYDDMALLQEVVRSIRRSGGICNDSTGIHIHIDFEPYDTRTLRNLVNIFASKEDMLYQALTQKSASPRVTQSENPRYTFRCWLIRIGLNGLEFKNCRKHLISHLEGNIAWLHPEDAIKQRERIKAERQAAHEQRVEPVREVQLQVDNVPDEVIEPQENEREPVLEDEDLEQENTFEMSM